MRMRVGMGMRMRIRMGMRMRMRMDEWMQRGGARVEGGCRR